MPLYFYWLCCFARFWNSLLTINNALLTKLFKLTVQNEVHVLFHCQDLFVCSLRIK